MDRLLADDHFDGLGTLDMRRGDDAQDAVAALGQAVERVCHLDEQVVAAQVENKIDMAGHRLGQAVGEQALGPAGEISAVGTLQHQPLDAEGGDRRALLGEFLPIAEGDQRR